MPKKSGVTLVKNEKEEFTLARLTIGWKVWIDYKKIKIL